MSVGYTLPRGTRASLDIKATAGELLAGQAYLLTDEDRIAVGLSTSTYQTYAKEEEAGGAASGAPSFIHGGGRVYLYTNNEWVTDSDDLYGPAIYQYNERCGTGATPTAEWEHMGIIIPAGVTVDALNIAGRQTADVITDLDLYAIFRSPTGANTWETGFDADTEDADTVIYHDLLYNPVGGGAPFTGAANDTHARRIVIDETAANLAFLSLYFKPVGTIATQGYFPVTFTWELSG